MYLGKLHIEYLVVNCFTFEAGQSRSRIRINDDIITYFTNVFQNIKNSQRDE